MSDAMNLQIGTGKLEPINEHNFCFYKYHTHLMLVEIGNKVVAIEAIVKFEDPMNKLLCLYILDSEEFFHSKRDYWVKKSKIVAFSPGTDLLNLGEQVFQYD